MWKQYSSCFQLGEGEGPIRGLLRDYKPSYGSSFPALNSRLHSTRLPTPPDLRVESEDAGVPGGEGGGCGGARAARALLWLTPAPRPSRRLFIVFIINNEGGGYINS